MSARGKDRKRALDFLYESDMRGSDVLALLTSRPPEDISEGEYSKFLVEGVIAHKEKIDELITTYAQGWDMDRMPAIDRNILRLAIFEILYTDLDDQIAASQAVELATDLSTIESASYVNGVLGRIIVLKPAIVI